MYIDEIKLTEDEKSWNFELKFVKPETMMFTPIFLRILAFLSVTPPSISIFSTLRYCPLPSMA